MVAYGGMDKQVECSIKVLLETQACWVSHKQHWKRVSDQPWYGPMSCSLRCKVLGLAHLQALEVTKAVGPDRVTS